MDEILVKIARSQKDEYLSKNHRHEIPREMEKGLRGAVNAFIEK